MYFTDVYSRLSMWISLLTSQDYDFTIAQASADTGVQIGIVRKDIAAIYKSRILLDIISEEDLLDKDDWDLADKKMLNSIYGKHAGYISEGKYDNTVMSADGYQFGMDECDYLIPLTHMEYPYVSSWHNPRKQAFNVKSLFGNAEIRKKQNLIKQLTDIANDNYPVWDKACAASGKILGVGLHGCKAIIFDYVDRFGEKSFREKCIPVMIRINTENPEDARCISADGRIFVLIRMDNVSPSDSRGNKVLESYTEEIKRTPDYWDMVWKYPSNDSEEAFDVKLCVYAQTRNIITKIRAYVKGRKNGQLTESDEMGTWIYTDRIIGKNDFKLWIRSFGSAIRIVEPKWLADEVLSDFDKLTRQYESDSFE